MDTSHGKKQLLVSLYIRAEVPVVYSCSSHTTTFTIGTPLISELAAALSSANTLKTLVSSALDAKSLAERNAILAEIAELYSKLIAVNIAVSQSHADHQSVLREKRDLEEKLIALESNKADFARYMLHELSPGVLVYVVRPSEQQAEPTHYLCTNCYNTGKKSILNRGEHKMRIAQICPACNTAFPTGESAFSISHVNRSR